jgi:diguanylate cyclase (GGDEF)-like protein
MQICMEADRGLMNGEFGTLQAWLAGLTAAAVLVLAAVALIGLDVPASAPPAAPSAYYATVAAAALMIAVLLGVEFHRTGTAGSALTGLAFLILAGVTADQHWRADMLPPDATRWVDFINLETAANLTKHVLFCIAIVGAAAAARCASCIIAERWRTAAMIAAAVLSVLLAVLVGRLLDADVAAGPDAFVGPLPAWLAHAVLWGASAAALLALFALGGLRRGVELWIAVGILGQFLAVMIGLKLVAPHSMAWYGAVVCATAPLLALLVLLLHGLVVRHDKALRAFGRLELLARVDGLTGLMNRRYFDTRLEREWRRASREGKPLALVLIDIDGFRAFNERYGHVGGDDCLRRVAACIATTVERPGDVTARYGGDEFSVILPTTSIEGVRRIGMRICNGVRRLGIPTSPEVGVVTVSIGIAALVPNADLPMTTIVETADRALYRAKAAGRDRVAEDLEAIPVNLAAAV